MSRNSGQRKPRPQGEADDAPPRPEIGGEGDAPHGVVGDHRDGATGDAEPRQWPPAEDEAGGQGDQRGGTGTCDGGRYRHVAGAADHIRQRIEHPDQDGAREDHIGVGQRRREGRPTPTQGTVEPSAAAQDGQHEDEPEGDGDGQRMEH